MFSFRWASRVTHMVLGHYGLALATKRAAPRVSLGTLTGAAQLTDLIWPVLLLVGLEQVTIVPNANPFLRLSFDSYPWTHSLLMAGVLGALAGVAYVAVSADRRGGLVVGLLVVSHWALDWIVHVPDLPLYPGGPRVGLGLWQSMSGTIGVETVMFVIGVALYTRATRPTDRIGGWAWWAFVVSLVVLYVASIYTPPPATVSGLAWAALAGWLIPLFGWWVDRHRASS